MRYPGLIGRLERLLGESQGASLNVREVTDALAGQGVTYDQVAQCVGAFQAAGLLRAGHDGSYAINPDAFLPSQPARLGALHALSWVGGVPDDLGECELLVAAPSDVSPLAREGYERRFSDLRTAVRALVAEAQHRILLAAPFWDVEVAADLASLLLRRQDAGVLVAILARQPQAGSINERALATIRETLPDSSRCELRVLEQPSTSDPFGSTTFHFKAACADGIRAYVGSANFNTAGLASRWELGVRLGGTRARMVSDLLEILFAAARPL